MASAHRDRDVTNTRLICYMRGTRRSDRELKGLSRGLQRGREPAARGFSCANPPGLRSLRLTVSRALSA